MTEGDMEFDEQFEKEFEDILRGADSSDNIPISGDNLIPEPENRGPRHLDEKEVQVMGVYEHQEQGMSPQAFVLLRDNQGRQVFIWIGRPEAVAISIALEGSTFDRPMTHDLLKNVVDRFGGRIDRVIIDDLWQETYYAKITISTETEVLEIDSRPSDAIALALRAHAPIFMAEEVLQQAHVNDEL